MTAQEAALLIRDLNVSGDVHKMASAIQCAIDDAVRETYKPRMIFMQDNDCHWYLIPENEAKEFDRALGDIGSWVDFNTKWGTKELPIHPSQYSFTDLQKRKP